uniref:Lysosomal acid phosphatase n=1 Tax=Globodera pallida TaxID=36090 RepID=A0A183BZ22_GLOPA
MHGALSKLNAIALFSTQTFLFIVILGAILIQSAKGQWTQSPPSSPTAPSPPANKDELVFVHTVWRHGDRTPVFIFPNDPNQEEVWSQGFGELTTVSASEFGSDMTLTLKRGMAQQVKLGHFLRKRYIEQLGLLSSQYNSKEVYVISTDVNRTIQSATANMIGMYSAGARWGTDYPDVPEWPSAFVPVPVHTYEFKKDPVGLTRSFCQRTNELFDLVAQSPEYQQLNESSLTIMEKVSEYAGAEITLSNLWTFIEAVNIERTHGLKPPEWAVQIVSQLIAINTKLIDFNSGLGLKPFLGIDFAVEVPKMLGGTFLWQIIERMDQKIECLKNKAYQNQSPKGILANKLPSACRWMNSLKYYAHSAHDMTLAALFSTFQFDHADFDRNGLPDYAACALIELWRVSQRDEFYVKVLYRRDDEDELIDMTTRIRGCEHGACSFDTFRQRSMPFKPEPDTETLCRTPLVYRPIVSPPSSAGSLPGGTAWTSIGGRFRAHLTEIE